MEEYQTEEEQLEALKRWMQEYGRSVLTGIVLCLILVFGWRAWHDHQSSMAQAASDAFESLYQASAKATSEGATDIDKSTVAMVAEPLLDDWSETVYGHLSLLLLAKQAVFDGDLDEAEAHLSTVLASTDDPALIHLVRVRLARILLAKGEFEKALALTQGMAEDSVYAATYYELQGDIWFAMGKKDKSREAYQRALKVERNQRPFVEMKLGDLS